MSRLMAELSSFPSTASTSQEDHASNSGSTSSRKLKVTLLSIEWGSTKGGLSTINRELAIQLAKHPSVEVSVYLPLCSEEDRQVAASHNVQLIEAEEIPGYDPVDWLSFLPENHFVDCVIGYGAVLGRQVQGIKRQCKCKWFQVVDAAPEEMGMYRSLAVVSSKGQKNHLAAALKLCEKADQVVAVGPKLAEAFSGYLRAGRKDQDVLNLTPGIFSEFCDVKQATEERKTFSVLVFGSGDNEDFQLKGYDIAARAIAELKDEPQPYKLLFVGATSGEEKKAEDLLLQQGIDRSQLTVRCFNESREQLARLFCEVDLAIMPSRTEGFGLAALKALSAGLPVLVSGNSGLGEALKKVPFASTCVVQTEDPKYWANAIKAVRKKARNSRLEESEILRGQYAAVYSWRETCYKLVERMHNICHLEHPWSHEPQEHDLESLQQHDPEMRVEKLTVHHDPFTVRRQVQPWEQAVSLEPYHNPESDSAQVTTDSAQLSQEQPESLHHAMSRLSTSPTKYPMSLKLVPRPTETVETFSRQLKPEQSIQGELDAPDSAAGAVANVQVDEKLKRRLQDEGCFLDPEKYDPVKRLGHGGYARVFLVIEKDTGQRMACKMFDLSSIMNDTKKTKKLVKSLKTEVNVLSSLKHEHIVKFFRMEEEQETAILLLEYMEGGTLMDWLKQGEPLQEPLVKKFTRQLLSAVNFLHTNGTKHVIHKDIKGANILLDKPRTNIKLADFGICTIMEQLRTATGQLTSNNEASFYWTSPELLGEETFGRNTDIWSVGCTVIEMLTTKPPLFFENLTLDQKRFRIVHCQVDPPENCSPGASEFLQRCLRPRSERPSAAELLTDPFVVDQQQ